MTSEPFPFCLANAPAVHGNPIETGAKSQHADDRRGKAGSDLAEREIGHAYDNRQDTCENNAEPGRPARSLCRLVCVPPGKTIVVDTVARVVAHDVDLRRPCRFASRIVTLTFTGFPKTRLDKRLRPNSRWGAGDSRIGAAKTGRSAAIGAPAASRSR